MTRTDDTPVASYPDLLRLDGKVVVVVAAGQGIGRQAPHAVASLGAQVLCEEADLAADNAALLVLSSALAGYITGQTVVVDGGVGVKFPSSTRS